MPGPVGTSHEPTIDSFTRTHEQFYSRSSSCRIQLKLEWVARTTAKDGRVLTRRPDGNASAMLLARAVAPAIRTKRRVGKIEQLASLREHTDQRKQELVHVPELSAFRTCARLSY